MRKKEIMVYDTMQTGYVYTLTEPQGLNFDADFKPDLTPQEMLQLGVFGGKYMTDCQNEYPKEWFMHARLSPDKKNATLNYFGVNASQSLRIWKAKGWIYKDDPRGWFQWYCRYYLGRRIPDEDARQIRRWRAMTRHIAGLRNHCRAGDIFCRPRQRQALLHWAYDSRRM